MLQSKKTRFRAYQLGNKGSSFSYWDGHHFTLIEARLTEISRKNLDLELQLCGKSQIDALHITGWDCDHCNQDDLVQIFMAYRPISIEYPGYEPHTEIARRCLLLIKSYQLLLKKSQTLDNNIRVPTLVSITPSYIKCLEVAKSLGYKNIYYSPLKLYGKSNDNSTIKLFRTGSFNVASLGDVEHSDISSYLAVCGVFSKETDVLVLPHHGSDSGFITNNFLKRVNPKIAICSSDYDNQYDHPSDIIRNLLHDYNIRLLTTKTGDVIVKSIGDHKTRYCVDNLIANSSHLSSTYEFVSKKSKMLVHNDDTLRNRYRPAPYYTTIPR